MRRRGVTRRLRAGLLVAVAVVAGSIALLVESGRVWRSAELSTMDWRFEIRGEQPPPEDVVVVAIDAESFGDLGQRFPFKRSTFAKALDEIGADDPRAIVYDVQFTESSGDTEEEIAEDNALIEASRARGNVVFSTTEVSETGTTNVFGGPDGQEYGRATVGNGLLPIDPGGFLRRVPYTVEGVPTLAVATMGALGRKVDRKDFEPDGAWIDFSGPSGHLRTVSFGTVVLGRAQPGLFKDRIAVIGASAPSLQDRHPVSFGHDLMAGPEIQANAISTVLRGVPLRPSTGWVDALIALGLSVFAPLIGLRGRGLVVSLLTGVAVAAGYLVVAQLAFNSGRILPVAGPMAGLTFGLVGALGAHYLTSTVERAQMRDLFARFVPDSVVSEVLARADREDPRLGGVRLISTVMFSDLRGFTAFAEDREPEVVIDVLNQYLTLMSDAILDHDGTLVAYMGDGVMAVFGAPIGSNDHADRALAAARAMLGRLEEFNAWMRERGFGDGFKMGIGLNTGGVMSGNVGSARRLEYTAIGDTTNTAARLEAMTKGTSYQCFVAAPTYQALSLKPPDLEFVDDLEVRGRQSRIGVWGLKGTATVPEP